MEPGMNNPQTTFNSLIPVMVSPLAPREILDRTSPIRVAVHYYDGATLTFLFDRDTLVTNLNGMISRAGWVRKVVL